MKSILILSSNSCLHITSVLQPPNVYVHLFSPSLDCRGLYLRYIWKQRLERGVTRSYNERKREREKLNNVVQQFAFCLGVGGVGRIMHRASQERNSVMQKRRREPTTGLSAPLATQMNTGADWGHVLRCEGKSSAAKRFRKSDAEIDIKGVVGCKNRGQIAENRIIYIS
jgi:hypothetical protein